MDSQMKKIVDKLTNSMSTVSENKTSPYETPAEVIRIDEEDNMAWVRIPGGTSETPVKRTINCLPGDTVQVRVSNGTAFIQGNETAPPTDDRVANIASNKADEAQLTADEAYEHALTAQESASRAQNAADRAEESATAAEGSAATANKAAGRALTELSTVEDVVNVLNWISEHGKYELTTDTTPIEGKFYWSKAAVENPSGNPREQGYFEYYEDDRYYELTPDTTVTSGKTYYILTQQSPVSTDDPSTLGYLQLKSVDEAIGSYINTHLALTDEGLYVISDKNGWRVLIKNNGIYMIDSVGETRAIYSNAVVIGKENKQRFEVTESNAKFITPYNQEAFVIDSDAYLYHDEYFSTSGLIRYELEKVLDYIPEDNINVNIGILESYGQRVVQKNFDILIDLKNPNELLKGLFLSYDNENNSVKLKANKCSIKEDLPYEFCEGSSVVYNNKIHILGGRISPFTENSEGSTNHYSYDGTSWSNESTLPYNFVSAASIVYNNKIHILGGRGNDQQKHYSYDGTSWTNESTLPYGFRIGEAVVYNNKLHILGGAVNGRKKHYSYDGTSWSNESTLPYDFYDGRAVVYNNKIHILGTYRDNSGLDRKKHYSYDGTSWSSESTLPYDFYDGCAVVYDNEIHILGGSSTGNYSHYSYDGTSWSSESPLPYIFNLGSSVVYEEEMHILGGSSTSLERKRHDSYDSENSWLSYSLVPNTSSTPEISYISVKPNPSPYIRIGEANEAKTIIKKDSTDWYINGSLLAGGIRYGENSFTLIKNTYQSFSGPSYSFWHNDVESIGSSSDITVTASGELTYNSDDETHIGTYSFTESFDLSGGLDVEEQIDSAYFYGDGVTVDFIMPSSAKSVKSVRFNWSEDVDENLYSFENGVLSFNDPPLNGDSIQVSYVYGYKYYTVKTVDVSLSSGYTQAFYITFQEDRITLGFRKYKPGGVYPLEVLYEYDCTAQIEYSILIQGEKIFFGESDENSDIFAKSTNVLNKLRIGKYGEIDKNNKYAISVGNGTSNEERSNVFTVSWSGRATTEDMTAAEVSDFIDGLDFSAATLVDFIVEQGEGYGVNNVKGYYRKWNSGKCEFWYDWSSASGMTTAVWATPIYFVDTSAFSAIWNGLFTAKPTNLQISSTNAQLINVYAWDYDAQGINKLRLLTCNGKTNAAYSFSLYAVGTWK